MFASAESAYKEIGRCLLSKAEPGWTKLRTVCPILNKGCGGITTFQERPEGEITLSLGMTTVFALQDACLFLRDDLIKTTGNRIWGLTFTLHPDEKFNIEYDYKKPENLEETDETIDLSQALQELQEQGVEIFRK